MGFAVYHTQKGRGPGAGLGHHIDRTSGMEFAYEHSNPAKRDMNVKLPCYADRQLLSLPEAIEVRIKEGYHGKKELRSDAVKYLSHILTGSYDDMMKIFQDKDKIKTWVRENYKFMEHEFGHENIIRFDLHLDEKTPHIHCVSVPLTNDGRLSAKEMIGNRIELKQRQDRYAASMEQFGLQRGLTNTGVKHEDVKEYYKRVEQGLEIVNNAIQEPNKSILGFYRANDVEKQKEALKSAKMSLFEMERSQAALRNELIRINSNNEKLKEEKKKFEQIASSPEASKKYQEDLQKNTEAKRENFRSNDRGLEM